MIELYVYRIALLCKHKYMALVNNFGDVFGTIESLENDGAINVRQIYYAETNNPQVKNLEDLKKTMHLDDKVGRFREANQQDELNALYPTNEKDLDHIPVGLNMDKESDHIQQRNLVDYKKSLDKSIQEDSEIDFRIIVDSSVGSGALHEFVPASKLKGMDDWILESDYYKYYSNTADFPINIETESKLNISDNLNIYSYENGNISEFIKPRKSITGVLSHFLMGGASILPPIVLNVQPGDRFLDACSAPGGKSLLLLQTMWPEMLVCNDIQESRTNRIKKIMNQYLYDFNNKWIGKRCLITKKDARTIDDYDTYDKILVDVPCTNDRNSVIENDNNIFKASRMKERLRLPELQAGILSNCLRLLKPGGSLVYSTCSLSPIQNDGVVHMALSRVFKKFQITATVKDLSQVIEPFHSLFKFENSKGLKYGQMVLPFLTANFGPMYFSKITRNT